MRLKATTVVVSGFGTNGQGDGMWDGTDGQGDDMWDGTDGWADDMLDE